MPTQNRFRSGSKVCLANAQQLLVDGTPLSEGVFLRAHGDNGVDIFVSHRNAAQVGYILDPKAEINIPIDMLNKVWVSADPTGITNEKQTVDTTALVGGDFFQLGDGASWTPQVAQAANAATVEAALDSVFGANNTTVTANGAVYTVEFTGALGGMDVDVMTSRGGTNEIQEIVYQALSGTYLLEYGATPTSAINWNANSAAVTLALETVIGTGDVAASVAVTANGTVATGVANSVAANSDLTFASPDIGAEYNGVDFDFVDAGHGTVQVGYSANTTTFAIDCQFNGHTANDVIAAWNAALLANPAWPQFTISCNDGDGSGDIVSIDSQVTANGVNESKAELIITAANGGGGVHILATTAGATYNGVAVVVDATVNHGSKMATASANATQITIYIDDTEGANAAQVSSAVALLADWTGTSLEQAGDFNPVDAGNYGNTANGVDGVNSTAISVQAGANNDLKFTAPAIGTAYDGYTITIADTDMGVAVNWTGVKFTVTYDPVDLHTATEFKTAFDAAIVANPAWPAWSCAVEGAGAGVVDAIGTPVDTSAGGLDEERTITITIYSTNATQVTIDDTNLITTGMISESTTANGASKSVPVITTVTPGGNAILSWMAR